MTGPVFDEIEVQLILSCKDGTENGDSITTYVGATNRLLKPYATAQPS